MFQMFSAQQQKTYDLGYHKRLRSHHILKSVFMFLICEISDHTLTRIKSVVRDIVSTNNVQNDSSIFVILFPVHSCIKLQLNFQQTQPQYNIYRHIYFVSCILAAMPAWRFVLWLSTTLKSFVICRRENGQRNTHVFATVCKTVAL